MEKLEQNTYSISSLFQKKKKSEITPVILPRNTLNLKPYPGIP